MLGRKKQINACAKQFLLKTVQFQTTQKFVVQNLFHRYGTERIKTKRMKFT